MDELSKKRKRDVIDLSSDDDEDIEFKTKIQKVSSYKPQINFCITNQPNDKSTIDIRDLIPRHTKRLILTTYALDLEWLVGHCSFIKTNNIDTTILVDVRYTPSNLHPLKNIKIIPIDLKQNLAYGYVHGSFHGKLILAETDTELHISVCTSNLIHADYFEKTNAVWHQAFPKSNNQSHKLSPVIHEISTDFVNTMKNYFSECEKYAAIASYNFNLKSLLDCSFLDKYDFSSLRVILITSVLGKFKDKYMYDYGHLKIRKYLERINKINNLSEYSSLSINCSSLGKYSKAWIDDLKLSFLGNNKKSDLNLQVIWPTVDYIRKCGYLNGGSLFYKEQSNKILESMIYKYQIHEDSSYQPPHIKLYLRYNKDTKKVAWWYLTSSNLTKSALGESQKKNTQFNITNFEAGVIFIPQLFEEYNKTSFEIGNTAISIKKGEYNKVIIPTTCIIPPSMYSDEDKPWRQDKPYYEQDTYGFIWKGIK